MTAVRPVEAPADLAEDLRCAVCEHALVDHDPIGVRYCKATQAQELSRDCICRAS